MRFKLTSLCRGANSRARSAFTLVEVLAALTFMAIVIPVAVEGLRIASLAGTVGQRKAVAVRVAERLLNEWSTGSQLQGSALSGTVEEGPLKLDWVIETETWAEDPMRLVTVEVNFPAQGRQYAVRLSTLESLATP